MRRLIGAFILSGIIGACSIHPTTKPAPTPIVKPSGNLLSEQEEIEAIRILLFEGELAKYLNTDLINDGGGIFITAGSGFDIMAQKVTLPKIWGRNLKLEVKLDSKLPTLTTSPEVSSPELHPPTPMPYDSGSFASSDPGNGGGSENAMDKDLQTDLSEIDIKIDNVNKTAVVEFKKKRSGYFEFGDDSNTLQRKIIDEIFARKLSLNKTNKWELQKLSPISIELNEKEKLTVSIKNIRVSVNGSVVREISSANELQNKSEILNLKQDDKVKIELRAENSNKNYDPELFAFLHNSSYKTRNLMEDNGDNGDKTAGDKIYTYEFIVSKPENNTDSVQHIVVDVLSPDTLSSDGEYYNATSWGISYNLK